MTDKIIMAGLANNTTSLGEVFRRYVDCFSQFTNPDVIDLSNKISNSKFYVDKYPQFKGKIDHDIRYLHTTFHHYHSLKLATVPMKPKSSKKIGYFVWESSELYKKDAEILKEFDEIWTASKYCKDIFSQYISKEKIKVVGHPIPDYINDIKKFEVYTVLIMGNLSSNIDRKNIKDTIEIAKNFKNKYKEVQIIFKTYNTNAEETNTTKSLLQGSNIQLIDSYYSSEETYKLISKCHVILSLHKSEGFGLTLAEAMRLNTIPLATGYSGNLDFMNDSDLLIDFKLTDVTSPYFKGQWASPSLDDAMDKLINLYESPKDPRPLKDFIKTYFSPDCIASDIYHTLYNANVTKSFDFQINKDLKTSANVCDISELFEHEEIINHQPYKNKIVSMSLFFKNVDKIEVHDELSEDIIKNISNIKWEKYFEKLLKYGPEFIKNNPDIKIRIYLANDCKFMIPRLSEFCEIYLMKTSSLSAQPGMMWRFLAMNELDTSVVYWDADDCNDISYTTHLFKFKKPFVRTNQWKSIFKDDSGSIVYRPFMGCRSYTNIQIDIKPMMIDFIKNELDGNISKSVNHSNFFGTTWPYYGFDEWFLMTLLYPIALKKGLHTITLDNFSINDIKEGIAQYDFYQSEIKNNMINI